MNYFFQNTFLYALLGSLLLCCESPDVCDQSVKTPKMSVVFQNPQKKRCSISSLYVKDQSGKVLYNGSSEIKNLALELNFKEGIVHLYFKPNEDSSEQSEIIVRALPKEHYVSIACGYKLVYKEVSYHLVKGSTWIKDIYPLEKQIIDQKDHLLIGLPSCEPVDLEQ